MKFFDDRPRAFQILFGSLLLCVLAVTVTNIATLVSSPTDENLFVDAPSYVALAADAPRAQLRSGDLIAEVQREKILTLADLHRVIGAHAGDSVFTASVVVPATNSRKQVTVPRGEFNSLQLRQLPDYVLVTLVIRNEASDHAGMKVGDFITHIDGRTFHTALQADSVLKSGVTGKSFTYSIIRNNSELALPVVLASIGIALFLVGLALSSLISLGIALLLVVKRPDVKGARLLAMACLMWFLGNLAFPYGLSPGATPLYYVFVFSSVGAYLLTVSFVIHAFVYLPAEHPGLASRRWIYVPIYVFALFQFVGGYFAGGRGAAIAWVIQMILCGVIFWRYRKLRPLEHRKALRPFKTTVATVIPLVIVLRNIPEPLPNTVASFLAILIPLSLLYSIARSRALNLELRVRKNVQFSFASALWVIVLVALFIWTIAVLPYQPLRLPNMRLTGGSIEFLSTPMLQQDQTLAEKTTLMIMAIILAVFFWRLGKWGYGVLTKRFYRGAYDYRRAASEMAEVMGTNLNMEDLAKGIARKIGEMMNLKRVGVLFFRNQSACCCRQAFGFEDVEWTEFCLANSDTLAESLMPFARETPIESLPPALRETFRSASVRLVVPIRSKERLIGAFLIGEKRSETPFHQEDYEFLTATAKQASVAVENSFLYEELAEQERMKHELAIARQIQISSLPQKTPKIEGLDIAGISVPAFEVGGDYFDYLNGHTDKLTVIVGDVSGKGTSAALYMSKVQGILRSLHGFGLSPRDLFIRANTILRNDIAHTSFVTALGAAFDVKNKSIHLARAGHLPLYYFNASTKTVQKILPKGLGMGMSEEGIFADNLEERVLPYASGDMFVFVTDGITEGRHVNSEEFGDDRLSELLSEAPRTCAGEMRDRILSAVRDFAGSAQQHDDQTVVVVKAG